MTLIATDKLSAFYENKQVFADLSFNVNEGEYLCIIGENGSGKTTLMRCILGFDVKHTGSVMLNGFSRRDIGWLPQKTAFEKDFPASVEEVVMSGFAGIGFMGLRYTKTQKQTAQKNMELLEIEKLKSNAFEELSGGQKQKVLLCRALCSACRVLLLDEPVNGLDPASQKEFYDLIDKLHKGGMTVIMISHHIKRSFANAVKILHLSDNGYFFGSISEYMASELYECGRIL